MATSVRFATEQDIPDLVELGKLMHAESPRFAKFPYAPEKAKTIVRGLLTGPIGIVLVAEAHGRVIGMLAGFAVDHFFSQAKHAADFVLFVAPDYRGGSAAVRLINAWEKRAAELGAVEFALGVATEVEPERTMKLLERLGYRLSGYVMVKDCACS